MRWCRLILGLGLAAGGCTISGTLPPPSFRPLLPRERAEIDIIAREMAGSSLGAASRREAITKAISETRTRAVPPPWSEEIDQIGAHLAPLAEGLPGIPPPQRTRFLPPAEVSQAVARATDTADEAKEVVAANGIGAWRERTPFPREHRPEAYDRPLSLTAPLPGSPAGTIQNLFHTPTAEGHGTVAQGAQHLRFTWEGITQRLDLPGGGRLLSRMQEVRLGWIGGLSARDEVRGELVTRSFETDAPLVLRTDSGRIAVRRGEGTVTVPADVVLSWKRRLYEPGLDALGLSGLLSVKVPLDEDDLVTSGGTDVALVAAATNRLDNLDLFMDIGYVMPGRPRTFRSTVTLEPYWLLHVGGGVPLRPDLALIAQWQVRGSSFKGNELDLHDPAPSALRVGLRAIRERLTVETGVGFGANAGSPDLAAGLSLTYRY